MWKDIKSYEGMYQVNEFGEVKSLERKVHIRNGVRTVSERILKQTCSKLGYKQVVLCKNLTATKLSVHRLVAEAFIPNEFNLPCVNHKDGNPSNNWADNLEWCTYEYNSNYALCKVKQSERMKARYADLSTLHNNIPKPRPVCQLTLDLKLIKIWPALRHVKQEGFTIWNVRKCADCLGNKWTGQTHHGFSKSHKGYKWMWLEDYEKGGVL